jgi:hypothetical protein
VLLRFVRAGTASRGGQYPDPDLKEIYFRIHNTAFYPVLPRQLCLLPGVLPRFIRAGTAPRGGETHGPRPQLSDLRPELLTPGQVQDTPQEQAWRAAIDSHTDQARAEAPKGSRFPFFASPVTRP